MRVIRLALKCIWHSLKIPNDPFYTQDVNFWNMPVRKKEKQYQ